VPRTSPLALSFFLSSTVGGGSETVGFTNTVFEEEGAPEEGATYPRPVLSVGLFWMDSIQVSFSLVTLSNWSCVSSSFSLNSCTLSSNELFSVCKLLECYYFLEYEMHISAMLKFLVILLCLYFYRSPFTAVILPNFCYPNKNIFGLFFLAKFLLDLFAESCLQAVHPAGSVKGLWKIGLQFRPRLWTALSLLSGTSFDLISWCERWTTFLALYRHTIGDISIAVLVWCTPD
jgi:hypothetical protein